MHFWYWPDHTPDYPEYHKTGTGPFATVYLGWMDYSRLAVGEIMLMMG
jgi:hypothetical protein